MRTDKQKDRRSVMVYNAAGNCICSAYLAEDGICVQFKLSGNRKEGSGYVDCYLWDFVAQVCHTLYVALIRSGSEGLLIRPMLQLAEKVSAQISLYTGGRLP